MTKAIDIIKVGFTWQRDFVADHPFVAVGMIWTFGLLALAF